VADDEARRSVTPAAPARRGRGRALRAGLLAGLVLLFLSLSVQEIRSVDFWWQLRTGEWIVDHGAVPRHDEFTYTVPGNEFIEVRWLFYVLTYLGFTIGGPALLILAQTAVLGAAYCLCAWPSRRVAVGVPGAVVLALGVWAGSGRFIVRPEIVTFLLVAAFVVLLDGYRAGRIGKWVWALPLVQVVWSNTHSVFVLGPAIAWMFVAGDLAEAQLFRRASARENSRTLLAVAAAVTAACFVNPYGVKGAAFPLLLFREMHAGSVLGRVVQELRSPFGLEHWAFDTWAALLLFVVSGASFWLVRKRIDVPRLLAWGAVSYLAGQSIRNMAILAFVGTWAALRNLDEATSAGAVPEWLPRLDPRSSSGAFATVVLGAVLLGSAWYVVTDRYAVRSDPDRRFGLGVVPWYQATAAVEFLLSSGARPQLFHEMADGCYLDWAAKGRFPVFIDGRHEVFGEPFVEDYLNVALAKRPFEPFADRWGINTAMIRREELGDLVDFLRRSQRWILVHLDAREVVFVRDVPEHADLIARYRIDPKVPWRPRGPEPVELPTGWRRAIGGVGRPWYSLGLAKSLLHVGAVDAALPYLERAHRDFPAQREARLALAQVYRSRGREPEAAALLQGIRLTAEESRRMEQMLASLALEEGRAGDALAPLERNVAAKPGDALTWALLGKARLDARDYGRAGEAYRRATELAPATANYWVGLGHALAKTNDVDGALAAYSKALERDPALETVHYNVAILLGRRGQVQEAASHLREALRLRPDYEAAQRALAALEPGSP